MPLYFFDTTVRGKAFDDLIGSELQDDDAACLEGSATMAQLSRDSILRGEPHANLVMQILDRNRHLVMQLTSNFVIERTSASELAP